MGRYFLILLLLVITFFVRGQNLVPNGNFEIFSACPTGYSQLAKATGWMQPTGGTSDYFNSCGNSLVKVPVNWFGHENAHSGNGYAGFYTAASSFPSTYREYLQATLTNPLLPGKNYYFEMYVSLSDSGCLATNLGAYFSDTAVKIFSTLYLNFLPQVISAGKVTAKSGWTKISCCYIAKGGERYLTIGNFQAPNVSNSINVGSCGSGSSYQNMSYYYVDDVSLTASNSISASNILGNDTMMCSTSSILLNASASNSLHYLWSNGSTNSTINVSLPGTYWVKMSDDSNCSDAFDTINLLTIPKVNLGKDTSGCKNAYLTLDAQTPGASYLWSSGSTSRTITTNVTGIYFVTVTKDNCTTSDTINLTFQNPPDIDLGNDTMVCEGTTVVLDAFYAGATYKWQDGSTSHTFPAVNSGNFLVEVTKGGCKTNDSIVISHQLKPYLNIGPDSSYCFNHPVLLDASNSTADSYLWVDGSTSNTFTANSAGTYWVEIKKDFCIVRDSVLISQNPLPNVNLGPDKILCKESSITLDAGNTGSLFLWNDQSILQTFNARPPGLFFVKVTNPQGCFTVDSIALDTFTSPVVSIGNDTFVCEGGSTLIDAGTKFSSYQWQDESTKNSFVAQKAGTYFVIVKDQNQCSASDTVQISFKQKPVIDISNIINVCEPDMIIKPSQQFASYLWQDGSTEPSYHITDYGKYYLIVTDVNFCSNTTNIEVISNCPGTLFVPNAFTPNADGNNDLFYPVTRNLKSISWKLYNRWGELVFETNEFKKGWDGTFNNEKALADVYTYLILYESLDGEMHTKSGNVTLLK